MATPKESCSAARRGIWNGAFVRLMAFELLVQFGTSFVNPTTSNYAVAMGATVAVAGFLTGLNAVVSCVMRPLGGLVLQSAPRKMLLVVSAGAFAGAALLSALVSSVPVLGVSRVVMGLAFIIKSALVVSLASAVVPHEHVGHGVGVIGLSTIIASAIGPGIGSLVGMAFGYNLTFLISGLLYLAAAALAFFMKDPSEAEGKTGDGLGRGVDVGNGRAAAGSKHSFVLSRLFYFRAFPLAALTTFEAFIYGSAIGLVLLVGEQRGIPEASAFFFAYALVAIVSRPFTTKMFDKHGLRAVFFPTAALMCASMLSLAFASDVVLVVLAGVFLALGQGGLYPCLQAESVRRTPKEKASLAVNTFYIGADAGMAIGPVVSGVVLQAFGSFAMFMFNCGIGVAMVFVFLAYDAWQRRAFPPDDVGGVA